MKNPEIDLPGDLDKFLTENQTVAEFFVLHENFQNQKGNVKFSLEGEGGRFFSISEYRGDVAFSKLFLEMKKSNYDEQIWEEIFLFWRFYLFFFLAELKIKSTVSASDSFGTRDYSSFQVNVSPTEKLDCNLLTEDLCYWKSVDYRIYENKGPSIIGSLSTPYLSAMCEGFLINYTIISGIA